MRYKAFISYSHAADEKIAPAIQNGLHIFSKPWYKMRNYNVFRDQTNLSLTPHLWNKIKLNLQKSEYFILLASTKSAKSKWVSKEIDYWINNKRIDNLFIVLTDGQIVWNEKKNDFDWSTTNALPLILTNKYQEEPYFLDLKWAKTEVDTSLNNPKFKQSIATISASLLNKPINDLIGEEVKQHRKVILIRNIVITLFLILTAFILALYIFANWQKKNAIEQSKIAIHNESKAIRNYILAINRNKIILEANKQLTEINKLTSLWNEHTNVIVEYIIPILLEINDDEVLLKIGLEFLRQNPIFSKDQLFYSNQLRNLEKNNLKLKVTELSELTVKYINDINEQRKIRNNEVERIFQTMKFTSDDNQIFDFYESLVFILTNNFSNNSDIALDIINRSENLNMDIGDKNYLMALFYFNHKNYEKSLEYINYGKINGIQNKKYSDLEEKILFNTGSVLEKTTFLNNKYSHCNTENTSTIITKDSWEKCTEYFLRLKNIYEGIDDRAKTFKYAENIFKMYNKNHQFISVHNYDIYLRILQFIFVIEDNNELLIKYLEDAVNTLTLMVDQSFIRKKTLITMYTILAKKYLLLRRYNKTIEVAKNGLFVDSKSLELEMILANAYMLNDELDKCLSIHKKNKRKKVKGKLWLNALKSDIAFFRSNGETNDSLEAVCNCLKLFRKRKIINIPTDKNIIF